MTARQVADELNCSRQFVGELRRRGKIRGIRQGNKYVYPTSSVKRYVESFGTKNNA